MKLMILGAFDFHGSTSIWQANEFQKLGLEVIRHDFLISSYSNEKLIEEFDLHKPDIVFICKGQFIENDAIKHMVGKCKTALLYMDSANYSLDAALYNKAVICDHVFVCGKTVRNIIAEKIGQHKVFFIHEGFDIDSHKPLDIPKIHDVSFIGNIDKENRQDIINAIEKSKIKVFHATRAWCEDHAKIVSSTKINLSPTHGAGGTSDRTYKIMAAGGFCLIERYPFIEEDFKIGEELDCFTSYEECTDKVHYYLKNEELRNSIASNGLLAVQKYSGANFAKKILKIIQANI